MDIIRSLLSRLQRVSIALLIGFIVIGYLSLALVYWQQTNQQNTLAKNIAQQNQVLSKPLASGDQLKADYDKVTDNSSFLASVPNEKAAFARIVEIAAKNGINTAESAGKLGIPGLSVSTMTLGKSSFQVLSFRGIRVRGDNASILAFLADIDYGKTLETMVLKQVSITYTTIRFTVEQEQQSAEYKLVSDAVVRMMKDNNLSKIPDPFNYAGGKATNLMGDDPETNDIVEGFPDINTIAINKGYLGFGSPRGGYVLFQHDKINPENTLIFTAVDYLPMLKTKYFYTVEEDGTIRQFNGPDLQTAVEYHSNKGPIIETIAIIDVDIYVNRFENE